MLEEIKKERQHVPDFMYIQRLEDYCERLEKALKEIAEETGTPYGDIAIEALKGE